MRDQYDYPIAVYNVNATENKLIGVFLNSHMARRYLFPQDTTKRSLIQRAVEGKKRLDDSIFDYPVTVRAASTAQSALLKDGHYYISNGYPVPNKASMKGYLEKG